MPVLFRFRFLDVNAFIYGMVVPSCVIVVLTFYFLFRSALLSRYIVGMQPDKRVRDKMRRKRTVQIILFTKVNLQLRQSEKNTVKFSWLREHLPFYRKCNYCFNLIWKINSKFVYIRYTGQLSIWMSATKLTVCNPHVQTDYRKQLRVYITENASNSVYSIIWLYPSIRNQFVVMLSYSLNKYS